MSSAESHKHFLLCYFDLLMLQPIVPMHLGNKFKIYLFSIITIESFYLYVF